jgi:protein-S-isoprenylcysteine O-methyltransferase Ste14
MNSVTKRILQVIIQLLIIMIILFVSKGTIRWLWAWVYFGISILVLLVNGLVLDPELMAERGKKKEGVKKFDRIITSMSIIPILATLIISGLDSRFGWSGRPAIWYNITGIILMVLGNALFTWAMTANKFFSTCVRMQIERDHKVAENGPYAIVRHPGYTGYITFNFATPMILGSLWALIPAGVLMILLIIRTILEDNTLKKELDGYKEYAARVKYRLILGIF